MSTEVFSTRHDCCENTESRFWLQLLVAVVIFFLCPLVTEAEQPIPALIRRVIDQTNSLSRDELASLEQVLANFESASGTQLVVLLVASTQPETIEQYALKVAEQWKLGDKKADNGLLLVVALQDHAARFEVGYGLEGELPDVVAKRIIEDHMIPHFKEGNVALGVLAGVNEAITILQHGESAATTGPHGPYANSSGPAENIPVIVILAAVFGSFMRAVLKPALAGTIVGILASVITYSMVSSFAAATGVGLLVFFLVLSGAVNALQYMNGRGRYGSGGFGGFGGGGGGGGFSGGGGSFGGGGASGRW